MKAQSPEWSNRTKRYVVVIAFVLFIMVAWQIRGVFPIIIVSALIAHILNPLVTFLTRRVFIAERDHRGSRRGVAAVIAIMVVLFVLTVITLVLVPEIIDQLTEFGRNIPRWLNTFENDLESILEQPIIWNDDPLTIDGEPFIPLDRIEEIYGTRDLISLLNLDTLDFQRSATAFVNSARNLSGPAFTFLGGAFNTFISVTFLLMMTFYLVKDGGHFVHTLIDIVPEEYQDDAERMVDEMSAVWDAYLRGQLILCVVIGIAVWLAASMLGLPNAIILGLIAGVLEFIPNLGPFIAMLPAAFLALVSQSATIPWLSGFGFMIVVIIIWIAIQNLEAALLVPRIMGSSLNLHPFVVIIAVLIGAALGGALGVILAAPFMATTRVIARYVYGKLTGRPTFRSEETSPRDPAVFLARLLGGFWALCKSLAGRWFDSRHKDTNRQTHE